MRTIFEKIINREIPAAIVYEDDDVLSFLDIRPANKGHALIIPKKLFVNIFDVNPETLARMMQTAQKVAVALRKAFDADGVNIIMNNGEAAGQEVMHAHLHVIPRYENDGVFQTPTHTQYAEGEDTVLAEKIKNAIA